MSRKQPRIPSDPAVLDAVIAGHALRHSRIRDHWPDAAAYDIDLWPEVAPVEAIVAALCDEVDRLSEVLAEERAKSAAARRAVAAIGPACEAVLRVQRAQATQPSMFGGEA
jgi:hypothetical protein